MKADQRTADAFAFSWNNLPPGSVYTEDQVADWFSPIGEREIRGARVLEMGCGNGSLMLHVLRWAPEWLDGIDLGSAVGSAMDNLKASGFSNWSVHQDDMTSHESAGYELVYSIGVLHHLEDPKLGFDSVVRNTRAGGRFHCWVYAREGNTVIIRIVDPIRRVATHLPWWLTKYGLATPLVSPFFVYAKLLAALPRLQLFASWPLYEYSLWIARRKRPILMTDRAVWPGSRQGQPLGRSRCVQRCESDTQRAGKEGEAKTPPSHPHIVIHSRLP